MTIAKLTVALLLGVQLCSGSIVVFAFGKKSVVVGADSRETFSDGTFKDEGCKIGAFGNDVVFTHVGVGSFGVTDLMAEAGTAAELASQDSGAGTIAQKAANRWKDRASIFFGGLGAQQLGQLANLNGSPELAAFMFASADPSSGELSIWYTTVTFIGVVAGTPELKAEATPYGVDSDDDFKLRALGHQQIFWEYAQNKTPRSNAWRHDLQGILDPSLQKTVKGLVKLTIDNDSEGVGGDVDMLRLDMGKGVQWLDRKAGCDVSGKQIRLMK